MINLLQKTGATHSSDNSVASLSSSSNNTTNSAKHNGANNSGVFLIPPPTGNLDNIDKGSLLLDSLNIVSAIRSLELEKEKREKNKGKPVLPAKKESKNDTTGKKYEITKDMFYHTNTEAFLHVTHLLFDTYDSKETENRFRNTWPIYDKKMEGVYRRVVLDWLKEIVEKYPSFFKGIKIESIGGLIVNPGGERFIKFIQSLTAFVLHQLALRKQQIGYIKGPLHNYMECSSASVQVKNKQVYTLQKSCNQLMENTFDLEKTLIKHTLQHRKLVEELQNRKHANESQLEENKLELLAKIKENSSLFPENAEELFEKRKDYICKISSFEQLISGSLEPDPLCKVMKEEIDKKSSEVIGKLNDIKAFFERHERLWFFLQMDKTNPAVIDGSKLFRSHDGNQEYTSFNSFISSASNILNKFCESDKLWKPIDSETREKYASYRQRYQFLQLRASDLRKTDGDLDMYLKNLEFEAKILSLKLNDVDWRFLSKSENMQPVANMLTFTPAKAFDLTRTTGFSPALNTFLSNHSKDSFGTPSRTQFEMRRDVDSKLKTSIREYSVNQSNYMGNPTNATSKITLFANSPSSSRVNQNLTVVDSSTHNGSFKLLNLNEQNFSSPRPYENVSKVQTQLEPLSDSFLFERDNFSCVGAGDGPLINFTTPARKSTPESNSEARISRLLDSLKDSAIRDTKDCFLEESGDAGSKLLNNSLLDDWDTEKGLMDMSISNVSFVNDD